MILLAESGSTKTEWCLVDHSGMIGHCLTDGINPFFQSRKEISRCIRLQLPEEFFKNKLSAIHFYGAGCSTDEKKNIVKASLESQFRTPAIVESDLLGSARSLFNNESGIACILGTGSNSCFYDGNQIVKNVKPLGFILGDEGSGAALGKAFISDCLKGLAPEHLMKIFYKKFGIEPELILDYVYTKPFPNKLLSLFSFFLAEHLAEPYAYQLIYDNIQSFFTRNVKQYEYNKYPIRIVGSVAQKYQSIIHQVAHNLNIQIDTITENPIQGLIYYHIQTLQTK